MKNIFSLLIKLLSGSILMLALIIGCSKGETYDSISDSGVGGSTARFTIVDDYMYVIDDQNLKSFNISTPEKPEMVKEISIGFQIETIYSMHDLLFIGSQFAMYIYDISSPENPIKLSQTSHVYSCDPVVADNDYAYVTLRDGSGCRGWSTNELQIINITDPENTNLVKRYDMEGPYGLAVKKDMLFICDADSVKVYDKSDVLNLDLLYTIDKNVNDVIALDSILLLVNSQGIYEYSYDYNGASKLSEISRINE